MSCNKSNTDFTYSATTISNTFYHFTTKENVIGILKEGFKPQLCWEDLNYIIPDKPTEEEKEEFQFAIPMVCFCDIPLSQINNHRKIYGDYGIGLSKDWIEQNNISPVLYAHKNSEITGALLRIWTRLNTYLFSWDEIPGNDNGILVEFLRSMYDIDWVITAKIEKIDDGMTINVSTEKNSLSLRLNYERTKVNLKIDDSRTFEFNAKRENSKLNIYSKDMLSENDNKLLDDLLWIFCFTKQCEGKVWRKEEQRFSDEICRSYDDREWRYVPPLRNYLSNDELSNFCLYKREYHNKSLYAEINHDLDNMHLEFKASDIKYIIVSKKEDIDSIKKEIEQMDVYNQEDKKLLFSTIISAEEIEDDSKKHLMWLRYVMNFILTLFGGKK